MFMPRYMVCYIALGHIVSMFLVGDIMNYDRCENAGQSTMLEYSISFSYFLTNVS